MYSSKGLNNYHNLLPWRRDHPVHPGEVKFLRMKHLLLISGLFAFLTGFSQTNKGRVDLARIPAPAYHYQEEFDFDSTFDAPAWEAVKKGLHYSFVSTDRSYFRSEVPELEAVSTQWTGTAWKGEQLNTEILFWSRRFS